MRLMQQTVERKIEAERRVNGLIIESAVYGQLVSGADASAGLENLLVRVK